jgi:hypothetical protein
MNSAERRTNRDLTARINRRISEGWSLEKIGERTVWHMYGHLYRIRNGVLTVAMAGGDKSFAIPKGAGQ